jgi:hypothetical protein
MSPTFNYSTGDPNRLVASGTPALMSDVQGSLFDLRNILNRATGGLDEANLTDAVLARLGLNGTNNGRGASIVATSESRTNVAYGTLPTPDQVTVTLPTNGLLEIGYQATWQESVAGQARASIFIGANQLKLASTATTAPTVQEAFISGNAVGGTPILLASSTVGLASLNGGTAAGPYTADVTTGQVLGGGQLGSGGFFAGPVRVFAAAGTYAVSVQFRAFSGSVTVSNRKMWVKAEGYS